MYSIKEVGTESISLIHQMATEAFPHTYKDILSDQQLDYMMDMMYAPDNLRKQIEEEHHRYFIAYEGETPCGYLSIEKQDKNLFHLQKIYILPRFQGKGVGRFLIENAFLITKEMCPDMPCTLELNVNRENKAVHFYRHMGLEIVRSGNFEIGHNYYMCDHIMAITL